MAISFTQHTLGKIEDLIETIGYKVRYEKGNFKTGTCILENNKIVAINRFADLEHKITALTELVLHLELNELLLSSKQHQYVQLLKQIYSEPLEQHKDVF